MSSNCTSAAPVSASKTKTKKKHFIGQKVKLFRASEPILSVLMWGVNHTVNELSNVPVPVMLMPDDFKAYSKIKVDNHLFNKTLSLTRSAPLNSDSQGRFGNRFLSSYDHRFVIKTVSSEDIAEMHNILKKYHQFIVECHGNTLLPQFLGMYRLTVDGVETYMVVTRNVFSHRLTVHRKYDLKPIMNRRTSRTVTSPGLALPGPHPGARPGVGARRRAPGGRVFAHGTRPGSARNGDVGPPSSSRLTTHAGSSAAMCWSSLPVKRERVASLRLRVGDRSLAVVCAYGPNSSTEYPARPSWSPWEGEVFNSHLRKSFSQIPREAGDIESEWTMFSASIVDARAMVRKLWDARSLVPVVAATLRTQWWTPEVRDAVRLKKESYRTMLACGTPDAVDRYRQAKQAAARTVLEAKTRVWEEFGEAMEEDYRRRPRRDSGKPSGASEGGSSTLPTLFTVQSTLGFRRNNAVFVPGRGTLDQLYTLHRVLEGLWEFAQPVHMCFVDLEKAFDRVPRGILWGCSSLSMGSGEPLLRAVRSLYDRSRSLVRIAWQPGPSACVLERFAAECEAAGMRISTSKSEAMVLDRKRVACPLQADWCSVRSYAVGVPDRRGEEGAESKGEALDLPVNLRAPTLTYGHELWVMTERTRSRIQAAEMSFLRRVAGRSLRDRVRSSVTREELERRCSRHVPPGGGLGEDPGHAGEKLCLSAGLGTPRGPPEELEEVSGVRRSLGISAQTAASATRSRTKRMKKMKMKFLAQICGSTVSREASDKEKAKELPTFKDNDFLNEGQKLQIGDDNKKYFLEKLKRDVEFLATLKIMDYSLLVGIHDVDRAEQEEMDVEGVGEEEEYENDGMGGGVLTGSFGTPPDSPGNPLNCGGFFGPGEFDPSVDVYAIKSHDSAVKKEVYFMAIIDILTHYDAKKKAAHAAKTVKHGAGAEISTVNPEQYSKRFYEFMSNILS
ncbi:hypothetical protein L3Q82_019304 [Scortum barcoo]|uniref:Uncharacterized protein n=1 Tax=Scortum barcoo TaxID=214431 RepID=A0ACB8VBU7_9TELE|nr:hypothetical protein L3Q82_019304 [Scortum barcoo]